MKDKEKVGVLTKRTFSEISAGVSKVRGFGYMGLLVWGNYHQPQHWAIATGRNPPVGH